jgi:2-hydroxy-6-oxonona-2,4-dienedioate hydrolase
VTEVSNQFIDIIDALDARAEKVEANCGVGSMPFRIWRPQDSKPNAAEVMVLLHGGSGSWTHWIKNIEALSARYEVIVPDLPGLGDASSLAEGYAPQDAADCVADGLKQILGDRRYHLIAFSWGSVVGALVAGSHAEQVKSLMLVGPASMGKMPQRPSMQRLIPRTADMTPDEVRAANRENLARLMLHDRANVDDFAVYLQVTNTQRARFKSPQFATGEYVLDGIKAATAPLLILYGEQDASAAPNIAVREKNGRSVRPDLTFEIHPQAGHWLQYESSDFFNERCLAWIEQHA